MRTNDLHTDYFREGFMHYAELLDFNHVNVSIPRKKILKDLDRRVIEYNNFKEYRRLADKIETALNKLNHAKSVVERLLQKPYEFEIGDKT